MQNLEYDALSRQLERMRGMQYAYFARFFQWILITTGVLLALFLQPFAMGHAVMPFLVVTAGVQASFYLHFVDFARTHAAALEARINAVLGSEVLWGSRIEDDYFYPIRASKISGLLPETPARFFSVYTLHWCSFWIFFYGAGVLLAWPELGAYQLFYGCLLTSWTVVNAGYLVWYFFAQKDRLRVEHRLREAYLATKE